MAVPDPPEHAPAANRRTGRESARRRRKRSRYSKFCPRSQEIPTNDCARGIAPRLSGVPRQRILSDRVLNRRKPVGLAVSPSPARFARLADAISGPLAREPAITHQALALLGLVNPSWLLVCGAVFNFYVYVTHRAWFYLVFLAFPWRRRGNTWARARVCATPGRRHGIYSYVSLRSLDFIPILWCRAASRSHHT